MKERCANCGRARPEYIADPCCDGRVGVYCKWTSVPVKRERTPLPPKVAPLPPKRLFLLVCKEDERIDLSRIQEAEPGARPCDAVYEYVLAAKVIK